MLINLITKGFKTEIAEKVLHKDHKTFQVCEEGGIIYTVTQYQPFNSFNRGNGEQTHGQTVETVGTPL